MIEFIRDGEVCRCKEFARGRITKVFKRVNQDTEVITGVSRKDQYKYSGDPMCKGRNGTYLKIGEYKGVELIIHANIYDLDKCVLNINGTNIKFKDCRVSIDVYEAYKEFRGLQKISKQALDDLKKFEGNKTNFIVITCDKTLQFHNDTDGTMDIAVCLPMKYGDKHLLSAFTTVEVSKV